MIAPIEITDATSRPADYVAALLAILGDLDGLAVYRHTPAPRAAAVRRVVRAGVAPADGHW